MGNIILEDGGHLSSTNIPNIFIDKFMVNANGEFVKIYLYLLRKLQTTGEDLSISKMADTFEHTEKDILRGLTYWEKNGLLQLHYNETNKLIGITLLYPDTSIKSTDFTDVKDTPTVIEPSGNNNVTKDLSGKDIYTAEQVDNFQDNDIIQEVLFITENYLGRTLNATDIRTILYWYDGLKFSTDLIEYLIETCISNGHTSLRYMEKIALDWANAGIKTVTEARAEHELHSKDAYAVKNAFGISGRNLIQSEIQTIQKWTSTYAFSMDIIKEACRRTIQATGKASFEYADTILTNWHKHNVHTLEDIVALDANHQKSKTVSRSKPSSERAVGNRFNNFNQRTYNYDQLEKQLLNTGN